MKGTAMQIDAGLSRKRVADRRTSSTRYYNNVYYGPVTGTNVNDGGTYKEMSDIVTPRFKEQSAKGGVVMNSMSSVSATLTGEQTSVMKFNQPPGNSPQQAHYLEGWSRFCTGWGTSVSDYWQGMGLSLIPPDDAHNLIVEACTRVRSQIGRSNTDMWENLAEANKTLALLQSPLASWFKFEKKARALTAGLSAAQAWLVYRYGVRPLVLSVNDVLKNLKKESRPTRATTRSASADSRSNTSSGSTGPSYWHTAQLNYSRDVTETMLVRAMSIDSVISDFEYTYGVASKQLLTLPWELIPWSFVVDWGLNIGDFVGALAQSFYPSSLGQCYTVQSTRTDYRRATSTVAFDPSNIEVVQQFGGWTRMDVVWKYRVPGLVGPGIVVKSDFKLDSATRIADSFALVGQQITRAFLGRK